eukprot:jgi/Antlo1/513/541
MKGVNDTRPVVISGPSGAGKSTFIKHLVHHTPFFRLCISHTTRQKRESEEDGREYFFVSKDDFVEKINKNEFFEYQMYNGHYYGTSINELRRNSKILLLDWERKGVVDAKKKKFDARFVFIWCSKDEVKRRLVKRLGKKQLNHAEKIDIQRRIQEYDMDMHVWKSGIYDISIENSSLEGALKNLYDFLGISYAKDMNM